MFLLSPISHHLLFSQTLTTIENRFHLRSERKLIVLITPIHISSFISADPTKLYCPSTVPMLLQHWFTPVWKDAKLRATKHHQTQQLLAWPCFVLGQRLRSRKVSHCMVQPSPEKRLPVCAKSALLFEQTDRDLN